MFRRLSVYDTFFFFKIQYKSRHVTSLRNGYIVLMIHSSGISQIVNHNTEVCINK